MRTSFTTTTLADYTPIARELLRQQPRVLALTGPLGAGKTTLVQALAKELHISSAITSPTFTLQHIYPVPQPAKYHTLVHVDCYRLRNEKELPAFDLNHWCTNPNSLVVIEWANKIRKSIEQYHPVWVDISQTKNGRRFSVGL
jgi:tRNA threonylcarbamoyladenosine biosynthesis protein TsaE